MRAGLRLKGHLQSSVGLIQPYARVNLYRSFGGSDETSFITPSASTTINSEMSGVSTDLALGSTVSLTPDINLYGEVGNALGGNAHYQNKVQASIGVRMSW